MPPRITRLKWPRLFPPHEPLPFLHPRWYSVESATVEATASDTPKDLPALEDQEKTTQNELGDTLPDSPNVRSNGAQDDGTVKPRRVPQSLKRKIQVRKLEETKRKELREKSFYANDWRTPLMLLRKHTPEGEEHHVKHLARLEMPQGMRGFYTGNLYNLFLDIYLHTGCHVQVSRGDNHADDKFSALEMSGTLTNINMARSILNEAVQVESDDNLNAKGTMGSYTTTATPVVMDRVMPRSVWSMPHTAAKQLSYVLEPPAWSFQSFAAYVAELIISTPPPLRPFGPENSPRNKPHIDLVTDRLMALYTNPDSIRWASMHATTQTLNYLRSHAKIPQVRRVLELIDAQSKTYPYLRMALSNPATFNVLLNSASQALDLHTYNFLLRMMTDRGVAPNTETWSSLLHLVQKVSPRNAKHIITTMRQRQMLSSPVAKMSTANATSRTDASEWLRRGESIFDFIAHYDKLWKGKEWLDTRACNQILPALIEDGNLEDTLALVNELKSRNKQPNIVTTNILVDAAVSYRDLTFALSALENTLRDTIELHPGSCRHTFDRLGQLAFRVRAYNTLRILWTYACLHGNVSRDLLRKMQKTLMVSLHGKRDPEKPINEQTLNVGHTVQSNVSRHERFKSFAAIVAVGIEKGLEGVRRPITSVPDCFATLKAATPSPIAESPSSADSPIVNRHGLHPALAADLLARERFVPDLPFLTALRGAINRDLLWKQQGYDKSATLELLLAEAVEIKVNKKRHIIVQEVIQKHKDNMLKEAEQEKQEQMEKEQREKKQKRKNKSKKSLEKEQKTKFYAERMKLREHRDRLEQGMTKLKFQMESFKKEKEMLKEKKQTEHELKMRAEARAMVDAIAEQQAEKAGEEQQSPEKEKNVEVKAKAEQQAREMLELRDQQRKQRLEARVLEDQRIKEESEKREKQKRRERELEIKEKKAMMEWQRLHEEMQAMQATLNK
ncbi:unnamed protein product [Aureobasidium vineae]|uniref:Pentatricopeptide repeat protein n=1 Tax=Aureobasidium vineae TaxID=2773715 RepID=A0A9N8PG39_9PEZI|nr:unnamed protein product [Aureobasidium vineae]